MCYIYYLPPTVFSAGDDVGLGVRSFHSEHDRSSSLRSGSLATAPSLRERHGGRQAAVETGVLAISGYGGGGCLPWIEERGDLAFVRYSCHVLAIHVSVLLTIHMCMYIV